MQGRSVDEYRAPLFVAWQLTNRCSARCIACCEESGPDKAWRDELARDEALDLARRIADARHPLRRLRRRRAARRAALLGYLRAARRGRRRAQARDRRQPHRRRGRRPPGRAATSQCVQISVDGATAATHERVRPGSSFAAAIAARSSGWSRAGSRRSSSSSPLASTCTRSSPPTTSRRARLRALSSPAR